MLLKLKQCTQYEYDGNCFGVHSFECACSTTSNISVWLLVGAYHVPNTILKHYILNIFSAHNSPIKMYHYIPKFSLRKFKNEDVKSFVFKLAIREAWLESLFS